MTPARLITMTWACMALPCIVGSLEPPAVSTVPVRVDAFPGDWGVVIAKIFNGVIPEDFAAYFARDPERSIPQEPAIMVAPADGVVLSVKEEETARTLVISLGFNDVHVQRVPISGRVRSMVTLGRGHLPTVDPLHFGNVRVVTTIDSPLGPCLVTQITGFWTKRIDNFVKVDQTVRIGQRLGRILLGSTVMLTVPKRVRFVVKPYDRVFGGQSIVGRY